MANSLTLTCDFQYHIKFGASNMSPDKCADDVNIAFKKAKKLIDVNSKRHPDYNLFIDSANPPPCPYPYNDLKIKQSSVTAYKHVSKYGHNPFHYKVRRICVKQ